MPPTSIGFFNHVAQAGWNTVKKPPPPSSVAFPWCPLFPAHVSFPRDRHEVFDVYCHHRQLVTSYLSLPTILYYHHHQLASITQQETIYWDRLPPARRKSYHEHRITPEKSQKLSHHKSMNFAMVVKSHSICRHFNFSKFPNLSWLTKSLPLTQDCAQGRIIQHKAFKEKRVGRVMILGFWAIRPYWPLT